jgi:MFS family permease
MERLEEQTLSGPAAGPGATALKFGPIMAEPGVTVWNMWTLMFASLVSIGVVTGMAAMTPYVLSANLGIPEDRQGAALGTLALWQELALICAYGPLGTLADKFGRKIVYVAGFCTLALGYVLFPYASNMTELSLARLVYALGIGAVTGMLATVIADYGAEKDRGKLGAMTGFLNGLGVVVVTLFIGKLPAVFVAAGANEIDAGRDTMLVAAGICLVAAAVLFFGLKSGVPQLAAGAGKKPALVLLKEGFGLAARSRRIALSYASAFVARGDLAIVGLFAIAWGKQAAVARGMSTAEALSAGLVPFIVAQSVALVWPAVIAVPLDRMARLSVLALCMGLGAIGYCSMILVGDPLAPVSLPLFALLGIGQISAFLGAQTVIAKEAPEELRGSVIGAFNFCGAVGILILSLLGGLLFDAVGPWATFFMVGVLNGLVALLALWLGRAEAAPRGA